VPADAVLEDALLTRVQEEFQRVEEETREDWLRTDHQEQTRPLLPLH